MEIHVGFPREMIYVHGEFSRLEGGLGFPSLSAASTIESTTPSRQSHGIRAHPAQRNEPKLTNAQSPVISLSVVPLAATDPTRMKESHEYMVVENEPDKSLTGWFNDNS